MDRKVTVLTAGGVSAGGGVQGGVKPAPAHSKNKKASSSSSSQSKAITTKEDEAATGTSSSLPSSWQQQQQNRETQGKASNADVSAAVPQTATTSVHFSSLEYEKATTETQDDFAPLHAGGGGAYSDHPLHNTPSRDQQQQNQQQPSLFVGLHASSQQHGNPVMTTTVPMTTSSSPRKNEIVWLTICFLGIVASFVIYGLLLEYATSGGRKLHELSFLFVTSGLYTLTAAAGRYVRDETPTTIPPARFAILGLTSMGSTFFSVRSLRYVIYPIQVLAKSCKPVPVMLMGAVMGKSYPARKYFNVLLIVSGVALFMGGGSSSSKKKHDDGASDEGGAGSSSPSQLIGIVMLFISLCFDGGTGAYEDKLMSVHSVQPFDLMYNIQLGKTILAGIGLLVLNEMHIFLQLVQDMGFLLIALGLSGALGQVFIFVTIAKFGALTCSIIGLARKVLTLIASIYFYGHHLNAIQSTGLFISIASMVMDFLGKKKKGGGGHHGGAGDGAGDPPSSSSKVIAPEELQKMLDEEEEHDDEEQQKQKQSGGAGIELLHDGGK